MSGLVDKFFHVIRYKKIGEYFPFSAFTVAFPKQWRSCIEVTTQDSSRRILKIDLFIKAFKGRNIVGELSDRNVRNTI